MLVSNLKESYYLHRSWLAVVDIIRHLNRLSFELRSHRGSSTAYLSGDKFFYFLSQQNTKSIDHCMQGLETYQSTIEMLDLDIEFKCLVHNWLRIKREWIKQEPMENFNQHSSLLSDINVIIWRLAVSADASIISQGDNEKACLCYFLLNAHTVVTESIARLRGVSSYVCAKENIYADEKKMIKEEITHTFIKWHEWIDAFQKLPLHYQNQANRRIQQGQITRYFLAFVSSVEPLVEDDSQIPNSSEIFNAANQILSAMQILFNEGLNLLAECMPEDLDAWVKGEICQ